MTDATNDDFPDNPALPDLSPQMAAMGRRFALTVADVLATSGTAQWSPTDAEVVTGKDGVTRFSVGWRGYGYTVTVQFEDPR